MDKAIPKIAKSVDFFSDVARPERAFAIFLVTSILVHTVCTYIISIQIIDGF